MGPKGQKGGRGEGGESGGKGAKGVVGLTGRPGLKGEPGEDVSDQGYQHCSSCGVQYYCLCIHVAQGAKGAQGYGADDGFPGDKVTVYMYTAVCHIKPHLFCYTKGRQRS